MMINGCRNGCGFWVWLTASCRKEMVGTRRLELLTSTVSKKLAQAFQ